MRLLLINQYYPPDTAPTGQYLHQLARALVAQGHEVTVVCSRSAYHGSEVYAARETLDGVRIVRVRATGLGRRSGLGKALDYLSFYAALLLRMLRPGLRADVVVALTTPPYLGLLAKWAARWKGAACVHWIMDIYPDVLAAHGSLSEGSLAYRALSHVARRAFLGSPLILCLGDDMAARLRRYVGPTDAERARVVSVPLWSDAILRPWTETASPDLRAAQGWGAEDLVLMYSGNMGRGHRFGEFLEAAGRLAQERSIRWVFAGGGARREEVEEAARLHPDWRVQVLPYAPLDRLRDHLCSAYVHLVSLDTAWQGCMVPSKFQGIFAVGKPVIFVGAADNSLAQWIRASGGGWVVPEGDVEALIAAIDEARDPAVRARRGAAARAFAERHFDGTTNLRQLARLIERCGQDRATRRSSPASHRSL